MELLLILQIVAGMLVLVAGSGLMINALIHLARYLGIKEYMISFGIIGFATAFPELLIALTSQLEGVPELAYANAIGTAIVAITFIAGIIAIYKRKLSTKSFFQTHNFSHLSLVVVLLIFLSFDGYLSRFDGVILLLSFLYYLWHLYDYKDNLQLRISQSKKHVLLYGLIFTLAFFGVFLAADFSVYNIITLSAETNIPIYIFGLVLLAPLGAVPELIYEMDMVRKKQSTLVYGDLFTSVVINTSLVVGYLAIVQPFRIPVTNAMYFAALFLIIMLMVFNYVARSRDNLNWKEGIILLFAYLLFIISIFFVSLV